MCEAVRERAPSCVKPVSYQVRPGQIVLSTARCREDVRLLTKHSTSGGELGTRGMRYAIHIPTPKMDPFFAWKPLMGLEVLESRRQQHVDILGPRVRVEQSVVEWSSDSTV